MFDGSFCLPACIYRGQWPSYFTTAWIKLSGTVFPIVYLCIFCSCVFFLLCYYSRLSRPTPDNQLWFHLVMLLCFIFGVRVTFKMSFLSVVWVCTFFSIPKQVLGKGYGLFVVMTWICFFLLILVVDQCIKALLIKLSGHQSLFVFLCGT